MAADFRETRLNSLLLITPPNGQEEQATNSSSHDLSSEGQHNIRTLRKGTTTTYPFLCVAAYGTSQNDVVACSKNTVWASYPSRIWPVLGLDIPDKQEIRI